MPAILKHQKGDFQKEIDKVREKIKKEKSDIKEKIKEIIKIETDRLVATFLPQVINGSEGFDAWLRKHGFSNCREIERDRLAPVYLLEVFGKVFRNVEKSVTEMRVDVQFFDATEETLCSDEFREAVRATDLKKYIDLDKLIEYSEGARKK